MPSSYIHTLSSFSGSDLSVSFANKILGNCQSISWGIQREKVPVFTLGSADARSVSRGKRAIGGALIFASFDNDALLQAMKEVWHIIAPPAMFTAAGNLALQGSEDFRRAMNLSSWNASGQLSFSAYGEYKGILDVFLAVINQRTNGQPLSTEALKGFDEILSGINLMEASTVKEGLERLQSDTNAWSWVGSLAIDPALPIPGSGEQTGSTGTTGRSITFSQYIDEMIAQITAGAIDPEISGLMAGFSGTGALKSNTVTGSNNKFSATKDDWVSSNAQIYVPQGFAPIRGQNVTYADIIPPFDMTLTFANEYGQCAFKKIYDSDILNEGSGVSVDTVVMEQQFSYIARRVSPLTKGVYTRESGGMVKGIPPVYDAGYSTKYGYTGPQGTSY